MKAKQFLESASMGATSTANGATAPAKLGKVQRRTQKPGTNALDGDSLFGEAAPKGWEGTVKAMKKHKEIDNPWALAHWMKNKGYKSHKNEGQDPSEYDMEGDFVKTQIHTIVRVMTHLEKEIGDGDNLPEWVQMKISQAQGMLVGVMDYMISQKERGSDPNVNEHKKGVRAMKYTTKPRNPVAKNAMATIGGGGAGAHKDKKKAAKQGDVKHKHKEMTYESKLLSALDKRLLK